MNQKTGTLNCQGMCTSAAKQQMLINDFELYKMSGLAVQETCTARSRLPVFVVLLQM